MCTLNAETSAKCKVKNMRTQASCTVSITDKFLDTWHFRKRNLHYQRRLRLQIVLGLSICRSNWNNFPYQHR